MDFFVRLFTGDIKSQIQKSFQHRIDPHRSWWGFEFEIGVDKSRIDIPIGKARDGFYLQFAKNVPRPELLTGLLHRLGYIGHNLAHQRDFSGIDPYFPIHVILDEFQMMALLSVQIGLADVGCTTDAVHQILVWFVAHQQRQQTATARARNKG